MSSVYRNIKVRCPVSVKLDGDESRDLHCLPDPGDPANDLGQRCNGHVDFCRMRFDEFTFPGTHNAGTGQGSRLADCFFKNQDLDIKEQLDFGIRFFDLDVVYR